ncbi:DUF29 domain-containing protein [Oxalobacteraceae bacterium A2-2]
MSTDYEEDAAAWALEQVALLRAGRWSELDIEHIAEEIEDMNLSNRHQIAHRMAILMAHLLKWKYQPQRRGASWEGNIRHQRDMINRLLRKMPSLRPLLDKPRWQADVWKDALDNAIHQTRLRTLPQVRPWTFEQILDNDFFPD